MQTQKDQTKQTQLKDPPKMLRFLSTLISPKQASKTNKDINAERQSKLLSARTIT
jgi:hypothetical protein